jgi:protocatechuate 3,4-dioxygenase beta subunit
MKIRHCAQLLAFSAPILTAQIGFTSQQPATPDTSAPQKPGTVEGAVTSSVSKLAVKKATVTLRNMRQGFAYAAVTDAAGHFEFDNVSPGSYAIAASRDGYASTSATLPFGGKRIEVAEEEHVKDVSVQLVPMGAINGKVVDENGDPIVGALVTAMQYRYSPTRRLFPAGVGQSDDHGDYRLFDLQPGRYYVQAVKRQSGPTVPGRLHVVGPELGYPATFYPNGPDPSTATEITVQPAADIPDIDFRLQPVPVYHIRGTAIDGQTGQPLHNVSVQVVDCGPTSTTNFYSQRFAPVRPNGRFDVSGLSPGAYCVYVNDRQGPETGLFARTTATVTDQDTDNVVLRTAPSVDVKGSLQLDGDPPQGFLFPQIMIGLTSTGQFLYGNRFSSVGADGTFNLRGLIPDQWQIEMPNIPRTVYVRSIRFGDQDCPDGHIDLSHGTAALAITLGTDPGEVDGTVQDANGNPAARVPVTLAPQDGARPDLFKMSITDEQGHVQFQGVAPGQYNVFAWQELDYELYRAPEFLKLFDGKGAAVSVDASGKQSVQVNLISSASIDEQKAKLQ